MDRWWFRDSKLNRERPKALPPPPPPVIRVARDAHAPVVHRVSWIPDKNRLVSKSNRVVGSNYRVFRKIVVRYRQTPSGLRFEFSLQFIRIFISAAIIFFSPFFLGDYYYRTRNVRADSFSAGSSRISAYKSPPRTDGGGWLIDGD